MYTTYCLYTDPVLQNFRDAADKDPLYVKVRNALLSGKYPQELPTTHPAQAYKGEWDRLSISNASSASTRIAFLCPAASKTLYL